MAGLAVDTLKENDVSIKFGLYDDGTPALLNLSEAVNPHILLTGMSGAGKTHIIRYLCRTLAAARMTVFIVDTQGDITGIDGMKDHPFRYSGGGCSINPMRVDPNQHSGGVRIAIRNTLFVLKRMSRSIGTRQEADLVALLEETYRRAGLVVDDFSTWGMPAPQLRDLLAVVRELLDTLESGFNADVNKVIDDYRKAVAKARESEDADALSKVVDAFEENISALQAHEKAGFVAARRWEYRRLEAIEQVIASIVSTGLFCSDDIQPDWGRANRFHIREDVHKSDQHVLFHLILDRVFDVARRRCRAQNPRLPTMYIVLDEGKYAAAKMDDPLSPLNRIATEGRKYGLGLIMGVQSPQHLTTDALDNFGTQILLKTAPTAQDRASRVFKVPDTVLENLELKRDAMVSISGGRYQRIVLDIPE